MSRLTFRILSKVGLLLVAIGYFMPVVSKTNVFGAMSNLSELSQMAKNWGIDLNLGSYIFLVYLIFIVAVVGVILLILFKSGKSISFGLDWAVVLIAIGSFIILLLSLNNELDALMKLVGGRSRNVSGSIFKYVKEYVQAGGYFIFVGLISSVAFMLIASFMSDSERHYSPNKKCRGCSTIYSGSQYSCPKCNSTLYEETNQSIDGTTSSNATPINANYGDTWTCKECSEKNPITSPTCKGCGAYK